MYKKEIKELMAQYPLDPLSGIVSRYLYEQITYLQIKPGSFLNISQLAADLNVSRTTIREAITSLISLKLLIQTESGKIQVAPLSTYEMFDVYRARQTIEIEAARSICEYITADIVDAMEQCAKDFRSAVENRNYLATLDADKHFHYLIIDSCRNAFIRTMYKSIAGISERYLAYGTIVLTTRSDDNYPFFASAINQHFMLVHAFRSAIPDHVAHILELHLDTAAKVCSYPGSELKI